MKPIYKYIIIFLILGVIAWIIYFVILKTENTTTPTNEVGSGSKDTEEVQIGGGSNTEEVSEVTSSTEQKVVVEGEYSESESIKQKFTKIQKISDNPSQFYWYYEENNRIFYITNNGEIKKIIDGKNETVAINQLSGVTVVRPNKSGSFVLIRFSDNGKLMWGIFSSMDEKIIPLDKLITDAIWDSNNIDIIAMQPSGTRFDVVSIPFAKNYLEKTIIISKIKLLDVDMIKNSPNTLLFIEKFGNEYPTSIWQYNTKTKTITTLRRGLLEFSYNTGNSAYFTYSKNEGFSITDTDFNSLIPLITRTLPNKCSSLVTTAFCFVPTKPVSLFSWFTNSVFSSDLLYVYDTYNKTEDLVQINGFVKDPIDARLVTITPNVLYFINKYDNHIYALE